MTEHMLNGYYWRLYCDGGMYRQGSLAELIALAPSAPGMFVYIEHASGEGRRIMRYPLPRS